MRPIATDGVARSIGHVLEPCKMAELIEMPSGEQTRVGPIGTMYYEVEMPTENGQFWGLFG